MRRDRFDKWSGSPGIRTVLPVQQQDAVLAPSQERHHEQLGKKATAPLGGGVLRGRIGIEVRRNRFDKPSGSPGIRTPNLRIKSPLLCQVELATLSEVSRSRSGETRPRRPTPIPCGPSAGVAELA